MDALFMAEAGPPAQFLDLLVGVGQGLFLSPNNNAIMSSAPPHRIGIASGLLATVRVIGQGFSVALGGAVFTSLGGARAGSALLSGARDAILQDTFMHAFRAAVLTCMLIAVVGVFSSLMRGDSRSS